MVVLQNWNKEPHYDNELTDYKFIHFLMVDIFGKNNLMEGRALESEKVLFMRALYEARLQDRQDGVARKMKFTYYVKRKIERFNALLY